MLPALLFSSHLAAWHRPPARSDAFMVGATAVALRFCRPFLSAADKQAGALAHLDPSYYRSQVGS